MDDPDGDDPGCPEYPLVILTRMQLQQLPEAHNLLEIEGCGCAEAKLVRDEFHRIRSKYVYL